MPAHKNYGSGRKTYLTILPDGKFGQKVNEATAESTPYVNKKNETRHYITYAAIEGVITAFGTETDDYGDKFWVEVTDESTTFRFGVNQESNSFVAIATRFPNIDFTKSVVIQPAVFEEAGKDGKLKRNYFVFIKQDGKNLTSAVEKDAVPKWEAITKPSTGEFVSWDKAASVKFLLDLCNKQTEKLVPAHAAAITSNPVEHEGFVEGGEDDLPF